MRRAFASVVLLLAAVAAVIQSAEASTTTPAIAYMRGSATTLPSVWVAGATGGTPRKLGPGTGPLLSPDGQKVAASDLGSSGDALTLYSTTGGAATGYFNIAHASATALAWSPDSRFLAVALSGNSPPSLSGSGLAIVDTQTGTATMIAAGVINGASFAPGTSDTVAYGRASSLSATAGSDIYTVARANPAPKQITHDARSLNPVWGPRGIAFDHERLRKGFAPLYQIWLMQANGSARRQITHIQVGPLVVGLVPLAFSADGTRLAAEFEGQDTSVGYSVSILTGHATQLKVGTNSVSAWGISRDGRSVLISVGGFEQPSDQGKIESIPFSGGHPTLLLAHGDVPSWNR
jgi:Tol biopolymer transport system component